jgi:hypothetical protein
MSEREGDRVEIRYHERRAMSDFDRLRKALIAPDTLREMDDAVNEVGRIIAERSRLREALAGLVAVVEREGWWSQLNGDWACAECKPDSDMLIPGMRCQFHAAIDAARKEAGA